MSVITPVALIVFNRPEVTRQSLARVREVRPSRLFIVADGPRPGRPSDTELCAEVRQIVDHIDWPCEVLRDYADHNMGCQRRVSSGLDWVFSHVERAIVLEDDCVPHPDFFRFCDELLERYEDDPRVAVVTGDNFQRGNRRGDASYYFSRYNHVWGWATWKRAWDDFDVAMSFWPEWRDSESWRSLLPDPVERRYWERIFDETARDNTKSWDYQWTASVWRHGGLTATPNVNLVTNIGFGADATHTKVPTKSARIDTHPIGVITHPETVQVDAVADRYTFDQHFGGALLRSRNRPIGFVRWLVPGAIRVARRQFQSVTHRDSGHRSRGHQGGDS